ncbi:MAG: histidine kinase [Chitinophagaceae bacterium]|nr:histidine kinase [Chitinophagaceae bacterium]
MAERVGAGYNNLATRYYYYYIFPKLIPAFALYAFYLLLNLYVIPVLILKRRFFILAVITGIFIWLTLLGIYAVSYYRINIYTLLQHSGVPLRRISLQYSFSITGMIVICYGIYAYIRELLIKSISKENGNRLFRVMLVNNVTATAFVYISGFFPLLNFGLLRNDGWAIFYVFFVLPAIIICFINIYRVFPRQQKNAVPLKKVIRQLLIAPIVLSLLAWILFSFVREEPSPEISFSLLAILLLIATPLSWLLYVLQKERLSEMLNLQKDLGKTAADLQFLRSQINPHFLFNALNTIYGTALQENADRTAEAVQKLGDMMRFMLEENQQDKIPLSKEITYLTNYIELQKLRTQISPGIDISFTSKTEQCHHEIAPMLLIPFVENAFKHGISLQEKSWIRINISCDTEQLYFDVYNSVHSRKETDPEKNRSGIGLENVKQRLSLLYPQQHELQIRSTATEYFIHLTIKP